MPTTLAKDKNKRKYNRPNRRRDVANQWIASGGGGGGSSNVRIDTQGRGWINTDLSGGENWYCITHAVASTTVPVFP